MANKFYIDNEVWNDSVVTDARNGTTSDNLLKITLNPAYKSADRAITLDGSTEYASSSSVDFAYTAKFACEFSGSLNDISTSKHVIYRYTGATGYMIRKQTDNKLYVYLDGNSLATDALAFGDGDEYKVVYLGSINVLAIWRNGVELVRATGASITSGSGTLLGSIPSTITNSATSLFVGAATGGVQTWQGEFGNVALTAQIGVSDNTNQKLINIECEGYWDFNDDTLDDTSGNGNDLTGVGIDSTNYGDWTSQEWVTFDFSGLKAIETIVIDKNHNLADGATVEAIIRSPENSLGYVIADSQTVVAGEPVIFTGLAGGASSWSLIITDYGNSDGYISIPMVYMSEDSGCIELSRGFLRGYSFPLETARTVNQATNLALTVYQNSQSLYTLGAKWRVKPADLDLLLSVIAYNVSGRPVVWTPDEIDYYIVQILNAGKPEIINDYHNNTFVGLSLMEVA